MQQRPGGMGNNAPAIDKQTACEDLKALERRLTEVVGRMQPAAGRWRFILLVIAVSTGIGAYHWLQDPLTKEVTFLESLWNHLFFSISLALLILLFMLGIHKRIVAPSIIASRCRNILSEFNMSCDDSGKLILKPRQTVP